FTFALRAVHSFPTRRSSDLYDIGRPRLRVLGARPRSVWEGGHSELFGDYDFEEKRIRIWMRTAVLGKVTSYRGLLHTLLHEFCQDRKSTRLNSSHVANSYAV